MKLLFIIRCVKCDIVGTPSHIFVIVICRGFLPGKFAKAICRGNLSQLFAVRICRGYLSWVCFVYLSKLFSCLSKSFFFVNKTFLMESNSFLYVSKTFFTYEYFFVNSIYSCYCRGSYGPP